MSFLDNPNHAPDEYNVGFSRVVLKYGLISAALGIISYLVMSITGMLQAKFAVMMSNLVISIAISLYLMVMQVREHRDTELGGFISFGRAFIIMLLAMTLSGLISGIFQYLYLNFINPSALEDLMATQKAMIDEILSWGSISEDKLEEIQSQLEEQLETTRTVLKSPRSIINGAFGSLIGGGIVALIIAAVMKKNK